MKSRQNILGIGLVVLMVAMGFSTCKTDPPLPEPERPTPYKLRQPAYFPPPRVYENNPLSVEGISLGSQLYRDPILSSNGMTCTSCHVQEKSFSAPLHISPNGTRTSVPVHVNLAFKSFYNWNGSIKIMDTLCKGDFEPEFFNTKEEDLYKRLAAHPTYPGLFRKAFGVQDIRKLSYDSLKTYIAFAISQYMRTLISDQSYFDQYKAGKYRLTFDEAEGMKIFFSEKGDCFHCHVAMLFTDGQFHNNGLESQHTGAGKGRELVTQNPKDRGLFLTPTLRNIEKSGPYMHDGRYSTLEEVVEFYNSGVKASSTLDPIMYKRPDLSRLGLTDTEKKQLVAFLKTLTDEKFVTP